MYVPEIFHLCGLGSKVDDLPCVFFLSSFFSPTFASYKLINDKIPTGKPKGKFKGSCESRGFWQIEMRLAPFISFTSTQPPQFEVHLICLFSAISFSSLFRINDPGGLAGIERLPGSQDLRSEGEDPRPSRWISDCMWARRCVCVYACALHRGVVSAGWPDTGVSFRACLGNEAEMKPLTSKTGRLKWLLGG